jgi:NADH-quinone oxidoreductase subunit M
MGFVMLGFAAADARAASGAVLQMFSHGVVAGLLFAVVGRMVYDRTHTRELKNLGAMRLQRRMPFVAFVFVVAGLASMGMPGFSGFPAELAILIGVWRTSPTWAVAAAAGILIAAAFTLAAIQRAFFAGPGGTVAGEEESPSYRLTWPEILGAGFLMAATIIVGLKPDLLLNWIEPSLQSPMMQAVWKAGGLR